MNITSNEVKNIKFNNIKSHGFIDEIKLHSPEYVERWGCKSSGVRKTNFRQIEKFRMKPH